jgi:hypothetical protein
MARQTIEEYCTEAILFRLKSDEIDVAEDDAHFGS